MIITHSPAASAAPRLLVNVSYTHVLKQPVTLDVEVMPNLLIVLGRRRKASPQIRKCYCTYALDFTS